MTVPYVMASGSTPADWHSRNTCMALSSCLPLAHADMSAEYVKMFASTPSAFISRKTSSAFSHCLLLPHALMSAEHVMVFAATPLCFIAWYSSSALSQPPLRPHVLMSVVNAGAPGRNCDCESTRATSPGSHAAMARARVSMSAMASPGLYSDLFARRLVPVEWSSPDLRLSRGPAAEAEGGRFASVDG